MSCANLIVVRTTSRIGVFIQRCLTVHLRYVHGISLLRIRIGLPIFPPLFLLTLDDDLSTKCSERKSDGLFLFQSRKSTGLFLMHQLQTTSHSVQTFLSKILLAYWPGFYLVGCLVLVVSSWSSHKSREREICFPPGRPG